MKKYLIRKNSLKALLIAVGMSVLLGSPAKCMKSGPNAMPPLDIGMFARKVQNKSVSGNDKEIALSAMKQMLKNNFISNDFNDALASLIRYRMENSSLGARAEKQIFKIARAILSKKGPLTDAERRFFCHDNERSGIFETLLRAKIKKNKCLEQKMSSWFFVNAKRIFSKVNLTEAEECMIGAFGPFKIFIGAMISENKNLDLEVKEWLLKVVHSIKQKNSPLTEAEGYMTDEHGIFETFIECMVHEKCLDPEVREWILSSAGEILSAPGDITFGERIIVGDKYDKGALNVLVRSIILEGDNLGDETEGWIFGIAEQAISGMLDSERKKVILGGHWTSGIFCNYMQYKISTGSLTPEDEERFIEIVLNAKSSLIEKSSILKAISYFVQYRLSPDVDWSDHGKNREIFLEYAMSFKKGGK